VKLSEINDLAPPCSTGSRPPKFDYPCTLRPVPYTADLSHVNLISTIIPLALSPVPYEVRVAPAGFPPSSAWAGSFESDGILLYVSEASYTFGSTPLTLWIAPGPLEEGGPSPLEVFARYVNFPLFSIKITDSRTCTAFFRSELPLQTPT
jgi:hypothetical protein